MKMRIVVCRAETESKLKVLIGLIGIDGACRFYEKLYFYQYNIQ